MTPGPAQQMWTREKRVAAVFFVLFLAIQIIVPLYKLTEPRPARFGWQMYAGAKAPISATLTRLDGSNITVGLAPYFGQYRGDLDLIEALPPYFCRRYPGVKTVRLNFMHADAMEFQCR